MGKMLNLGDKTGQYAGAVRPCALCGCTETVFDVDCCDGCDRLLNDVLNLLGSTEYAADCRTVETLGRYLLANPQLRP